MGKKSSESNQESSEAIKSLFSLDNPFRRRPDPTPPAAAPAAATSLELGLGLSQRQNPSIASLSDDDAADSSRRRKKRDKLIEIPKPNPKGDEERPKKGKKRKREEVEEEYEKRKYGAVEDGKGKEGGEVAVAVGRKRKATEASEEMAVAKDEEEESFDDESKLLRTIFVGNLPLKTKKKALLQEFGKFGEIASVRIRSVPIVDSKTPRKGAIMKGKINEAVDCVHAYIVFNDEQSARAALSHNMVQIGGNHIRVDMACPPRKKLKGESPLYDKKRTVFVGNLPFDIKDEELYQLFCGLSQPESGVEAVRVVRDPNTSLGKGIAYVLFKTRDAANTIVRRRDLKIRDRALRVCHAKLDTATPSKRKDPGPSRDFPQKKFATPSREKTRGKNDKPKVAAASLSYQGLRSSKSGAVKKSGTQSQSSGNKNRGTKRPSGADAKVRDTKRPAVAARKAKILMKKRKLEAGTPENAHRNKKARRQ